MHVQDLDTRSSKVYIQIKSELIQVSGLEKVILKGAGYSVVVMYFSSACYLLAVYPPPVRNSLRE